MARKGFSLSTTKLSAQLSTLDDRINRGIAAAFEYQAPRSTARMRTGARWTDRTGNARSGLFTATKHEGGKHTLLLSQGVSYGIYLETRFSGRYAIVRPEIRLAADDIQRLIGKILPNLPRK